MTDRPRQRDKEATQHKILQALERVIARDGLHRVGINAVAREAGVDKVLVYRYFGGLPELIEAYATRLRLWPSFAETVGMNALGAADLSAEELLYRCLSGLLRELRQQPFALDVLRCELVEPNSLTEQLAREREAWAKNVMEYLQAAGAPVHAVAPAVALLTGGIIQLLLHPALAVSFDGEDSKTEEGWKKIEEVIRRIVNMLTSNISQ